VKRLGFESYTEPEYRRPFFLRFVRPAILHSFRLTRGSGLAAAATSLLTLQVRQPKLLFNRSSKTAGFVGRTKNNNVSLVRLFAMIQITENRYIVKNEKILGGEPIIKGTRTPVRAIVETWRQDVPPEEIPGLLPHLTLAQVFDALSYYSEHQEEINDYIQRNRIPEELVDPLVRDI
jgi:uncharacterized protein (DUF433 family)